MTLGPEHALLDVRCEADVTMARVTARGIASAAGFDPASVADIAVVACELARNLVAHAGGGILTVRIQGTDWGRALEIETRDRGPGIADVDRALTDGFSTNGCTGCGLGTVNRMMDDLEIETNPGSGTRVRARRWLRSAMPSSRACPLDIGASERRTTNAAAASSRYLLRRWDAGAIVGVFGSPGGGEFAKAASGTARLHVESHFDRPLEALVQGLERLCRPSEGGSVLLARFDCDPSGSRFHLAGTGHAGARLYGGPHPTTFVPPPGALGDGSAAANASAHSWTPDSTLVLHSAGLLPLWPDERFHGLFREPAQSVANRLICALAGDSEDAVVVVVKQAGRAADLGVTVSPVILPGSAIDPNRWG